MLAEEILGLLLPQRRSVPGESGGSFDHQRAVLAKAIAAREPIVFTLPAFPCKSPNPDKVLGHLPDLGERLSLRFLDGLCARIERVYPPGARMLICSDGHVFADLIRVPDDHVEEYAGALRKLIADEGLHRIDTFDLTEAYGSLSGADIRTALVEEFGQSLESLRAEVHADADTLRHYRGTTRFLLEDGSGPDYRGTRSALLRDSRRRAYGVLQRSRAWGELIAREFPHALRLSIHPQRAGTGKLGIVLLDEADGWKTPWHSVVLQRGDRFSLHHRAEAAKLGELVLAGGRPSHYVARE
ncbi:L-tyrosine/L-tryptophan isonitrile synthase family protein [Amycolatopsis anabasis]|uniref:L-tyrosine/L-tryptophan isonitrile synthase family protein n=1 Tax=Amycolatopsis anabasis TaxID=1840409 RepID=UPI00131DAFE9|nr:isocyanide synthase family protein [Amycolatopsis anabasis]